MDNFNDALRRIGSMLAVRQTPARVNRMWQCIEAAQFPGNEKKRRWPIVRVAVSVAAMAAVALIVVLVFRDTGPLTLAQGDPLNNVIVATHKTQRHFSDGSVIDLESGATLKLMENTGRNISFQLKKGEVRFNIRPGGPRTWRVQCGVLHVTVVGTAFVLTKYSGKVTLAVERGAVLVSGKGVKDGPVKLRAGDTIRVGDSVISDRQKNAALGQADSRATTDSPREAVSAISPNPQPKTQEQKEPQVRANWKVHADARDFDAAFEQLGASKLARLANQATNVDELFQLADVARLSGHPADAVAPLKTIVERFQQNPRAGLAAYTLGRLYLEKLGTPEKADPAFSKALALGIPTVLQETATVKRIHALLLQHKNEGKTLASDYLVRYPQGRYRQKVKNWLDSQAF